MKDVRAVLLMDIETGKKVCNLASKVGIKMDAEVVSDLKALSRAFDNSPELLLSFGTSVIVPSALLDLPELYSLNVHAASPSYPGRDPHHFAVYDGVKRYGATMHFMTSSVDAGNIVDVELFDVSAYETPAHLLERANKAAWTLIKRLFFKLSQGELLCPMEGAQWGKRKTTRKMFSDLCRVDAEMSEVEFKRRQKATCMPGFKNLYIEMHGHRFYMESDR